MVPTHLLANSAHLPARDLQVGPSRPAQGDVPSAGPSYRHISAKDGFPKLEVSTLHELFDRSVKTYAGNNCLGKREKLADGTVGDFKFETYAQVGEKVAAIASALRTLGVEARQRVGVFGANCPEWMMAMQVNRCKAPPSPAPLILCGIPCGRLLQCISTLCAPFAHPNRWGYYYHFPAQVPGPVSYNIQLPPPACRHATA